MPRGGIGIEERGRGPWCEKKMKKEKEQCRRKEVADPCFASGWHEKSGTRSRTVVRKNEKKKIGKERKNGGQRKSQTPVMPRGGMRIEEPGRGPWCENEKKRTNGGERKSRTSVMPRGGMRREESGRGP